MYQRLLGEHIESGCEENHKGSSSGMEAAGMRKIACKIFANIWNLLGVVKTFCRSESKHLLRYTTYIGDGDANNERALLDAKPYGETRIRRLQCVNHFSKR